MLGYGRGVFRLGRARRVALAGALSCALLGLVAPAAAAAGYSANSVVPADGRLNTPDYSAKVTAVAWPATNDGQEPTPGRRFVRLTLEVTAPNQSASPTSPAPSLSAALRWGGTSHPLSLSTIDNELGSGAGGASDSASASYMASVPNDTHDVDLVISEGTFSQSFDLWTLSRVPPSPAVLYRDPGETTIAGTAAAPTTLSLSNPADGFTSSADVTLQSATLGYVAPSGTALSPSPEEAVLSVILDGEFANEAGDPTGSGHYLGSTAPLPASMLSFTPSGGAAVPAAMSNVGDTTGKGNSDDGLFDATYSFVVPATLTTGTIAVADSAFTGAEFTLYTAESGTTTLDVTSPTNLELSFPALAAAAVQKTPPWVGQPVPATASASGASSGRSGGGGSAGLPIIAAVIALAVLAAVVVLFQRRRAQRTVAPATSGAGPGDGAAAATATDTPPAGAAALVESDVVVPRPSRPKVDVMGPLVLRPVPEGLEPRIISLYAFLVMHMDRAMTVDEIQVRSRPESDTGDLNRKTVLNNLSKLRLWLGSEHFPEAKDRTYLLRDIDCDWFTFRRLADEADRASGDRETALRTEALALVRGLPFEGMTDEQYPWIDGEHLGNELTVAIARCAAALAATHMDGGEFAEAERSARSGLSGAPDDFELWAIGARSFDARADRTGLRRWMREANKELAADDVARILAMLEIHLDPSEL